MKWIFGKTAMWFFGTIAAATVAFAAVQDVQLPAGEGLKILERDCTECHSLARVTAKRLTADAWESLVGAMMSKGAEVQDKEYPILIDYLAKNLGKDGSTDAEDEAKSSDEEAKQILDNVCTVCHALDLVEVKHLNKEGWGSIVDAMKVKGAGLSDRQTSILIDYLAKTYGPKSE